jgi:LPS sulfotransferase NodH
MQTTRTFNYLICTAPRTGSTLLAQALSSTNVAGRPNEYFDIYPHNDRFWIERLGVSNQADYLEKVLAAGTTANGVFGLKLLWHQSPALLAKLKAARPQDAGDVDSLSHALLETTFGAPVRYIWLRRRDKLAQAISYYRASRTGLWRSTDKATRRQAGPTIDEPPFDFGEINRYLSIVNAFDQQWQLFFRRNRLKVLMMVYENFIGAYESSVLSALDFLQISREGVKVAPPVVERQADGLSQEWRQRFLEIAGKAGGAGPAAAPGPEPGKPRKRPGSLAREAQEPALPLIAYPLLRDPPPLVKARQDRDWMEATAMRFAYRCLPMVIANQAGWMILNPRKFSLVWTGGPDIGALKIIYLSGKGAKIAVSLFGGGVLTFTVGYLFRTPPGYNLHVRGPANCPRDGVSPLEGIVESDWTEATFTMNWKVTRPNHPIVFEEGDPVAMISPVRRGEIERVRPELHNLSEDPALFELHREWAKSRAKHNSDLRDPGSQAHKDGWQRHYFRGVTVRKEPAQEHQTKLTVADFVDKRG